MTWSSESEVMRAVADFGTYDYQLSPEDENRAARLHEESTIVDVIWWGPVGYRSFTPEMDAELRDHYDEHRSVDQMMGLAQQLPGRHAVAGRFPDYRALWDASGVTAGHYDIQVGDPRLLLEGADHVDDLVDHLPWLRKALHADDLRQAKRDGGHALFLQCQPTPPISPDLSLIDLAYERGLRVLQLSYNVRDEIACGCTDRSGRGVSKLGASLIARLNELGVIVDTAHCNQQTVLDACGLSQRPVIVSHAASAACYPHDRGISDESACAVAATGGVIGIVTVPFFLGPAKPSMETMLDHVDHLARLVGWRHLAIATDWPLGMPKWALEETQSWAMAHGFGPEHGIVATQNLMGFDDYRDFPNITRGLVARGYTDEQVRGILGENFLRVFDAVCG